MKCSWSTPAIIVVSLWVLRFSGPFTVSELLLALLMRTPPVRSRRTPPIVSVSEPVTTSVAVSQPTSSASESPRRRSPRNAMVRMISERSSNTLDSPLSDIVTPPFKWARR